MLALDRLDENERALMERNEALCESVVGPEVALDTAQQMVLARYLDLRRQTPGDRGIPFPDEDPILVSHLRALDQEWASARSEESKAQREKMRAQQRGR